MGNGWVGGRARGGWVIRGQVGGRQVGRCPTCRVFARPHVLIL